MVGDGEIFSNVFITKAEYPQKDNNSYKSLRKRNKANFFFFFFKILFNF